MNGVANQIVCEFTCCCSYFRVLPLLFALNFGWTQPLRCEGHDFSFFCLPAVSQVQGPSLPQPSLVSDWLLTTWCNFRLKMWYWNQRKLTHSWFELQWLELWHYVSSNGCCVWVSESAAQTVEGKKALVRVSFDVSSYVPGDSIVNTGIIWCVSKPFFFFKFLFVWFGEIKFHSVALIYSNLPASDSQMLGFTCLFILILFCFMCVWFFVCLRFLVLWDRVSLGSPKLSKNLPYKPG